MSIKPLSESSKIWVGQKDKANTIEDNSNFCYIEFLQDVPEFKGEDLNNYGPFNKGQVEKVTPKIARILIEKGIGKEFVPENKNNKDPQTPKDWALYYHSLGFNVIPIKSKGNTKDDYKRPLFNEWKPYQTRRVTIEEINKWWDRWPTANIGLICGKISGFAVLDIDADKGGLESLQEIAPANFEPDDLTTPTVKTGRDGGGLHFYFKIENPPNKVTGLKDGIDFQGEGSYVIAPPSVHFTGRYYSWVKPLSIGLMEIPDWLLETIINHKEAKVRDRQHDVSQNGIIKVGSRNTTLTSLSGELYNKGYNPDTIKKVLHAVNKEISENPLPEREVDAIKTSWPKRRFLENDVGNAERMVYYFGDRFLYNPVEDQFYIWDGRRWAKDTMNVIWEFALETIKNIGKIEVEGINDEQELKKLLELAKSSFSNVKIKGMINCLKTQNEIKINPDQFDREKYLLCCENGILDLLNMEFREHRQEDFITMVANVSYDPSAKSDLWDSFIKRILPDDDVRLFVQKIAGLTLNGAILEQKYYAVYGKKDNGKSVFTGTIRNILGDYGQITPFSTFEKTKTQSGQARADLVRMKNKRLIVAHEIPADAKYLDENLIKAVTGGDAVANRGLYSKEYDEFNSTAKLIFDGNHKLKYSGYEPSYIKRTIFIHFEVTIPEEEQDKELPDKLKDPYTKSAILNWMFEGWKEYKKDVETNQKLTIPSKVQKITTETNLENDPVGFFIQKCCTTETEEKESSSDLFNAYTNFARLEGLIEYKIQKFGRIMAEKSFEKERSGKGVFYKKIKVKEEWRERLMPIVYQENLGFNPEFEQVEDEA